MIKKYYDHCEYLFRGTTKEKKDEIIKQTGIYYGKKRDGEFISSFSESPLAAMIYALDTSIKYEEIPILIALKKEKYESKIFHGIELLNYEFEVRGKIDKKDIIIVKNVDQLKKMYNEKDLYHPETKEEKKRILDGTYWYFDTNIGK